MNIKIASEKTGLTKKAIKYYESEGLIIPLKNKDNNYREYTEDDIVKLNLIGALRAIDIPTCEIKCLVEGNKSIKEVMRDTLIKITETISNLEKSKLVLTNIINKDLEDYVGIGEQVRKLRETLEYSISEKKELVSSTLLRIFPGNFGKVFVGSYEPFLNITIDSDKKRETWIKLVEFLDELDEVDANHPFIKGMSNMDITEIQGYQEKSRNDIQKVLSGDVSLKEKYVNDTISFVKAVNENDDFKKKYSEILIQTNDMLSDIGAQNNTFDIYLEILSEDYKKYRNELSEAVNEEMKNQFGVTFEEYFKNLK